MFFYYSTLFDSRFKTLQQNPSAKAAGIYTVALKQGFFMDQSKADIIINELTELVTLPQVTR
ncbi:hypothetical protein EAS65_14260 [Enterococcus faecium]|nr:hypothetical protein EAS65_14260 [Enterococcus faecium]